MSLESLGQIAQASAKLVDLIYEFEDHPDLLPEAISEHLEHLVDLLIAGGYYPEPDTPTHDNLTNWVEKQIIQSIAEGRAKRYPTYWGRGA